MRRLANRVVRTFTDAIGAREATLILGVAMVGYGAGSICPPAGFICPGLVLLYVAIFGLR
jgi:hypothetical protein